MTPYLVISILKGIPNKRKHYIIMVTKVNIMLFFCGPLHLIIATCRYSQLPIKLFFLYSLIQIKYFCFDEQYLSLYGPSI